jgi:hypothetical protein
MMNPREFFINPPIMASHALAVAGQFQIPDSALASGRRGEEGQR